MRRTIISFLVLVFSVWLGLTMYRNPGYVLVSFKGYSIETSAWFAVIFLLVLFLVFYMLLRFTSGISTIGKYIKRWISNWRSRRAREQTTLGLYDFVEGNWASSEKRLSQAAKHSDMPVINYLAAAFMAQRQQALERRDNYLLMAQRASFNRPITIGLTQARLHILNKQWEEALATLQHLHQLQPKNAFILQLLTQVCLELKDWFKLKTLLPVLNKRHAFTDEELNQLEIKIYSGLLLFGKTNDTIEIKWKESPHHLQKHPELVAIYTRYLLDYDRAEEAEDILKMVLRKSLDERLLELYAALPSINPIKKIARAEDWYKNNSENPALLLCLGRICKQQKLWGNARKYLEKSASLAATPAVYFELGQILEMQNDLRGALDFYIKGLQIAIKKTNDNYAQKELY